MISAKAEATPRLVREHWRQQTDDQQGGGNCEFDLHVSFLCGAEVHRDAAPALNPGPRCAALPRVVALTPSGDLFVHAKNLFAEARAV
jgi:hypothetical protein